MASDDYWIRRWIEAEEIENIDAAERRLKNSDSVERLISFGMAQAHSEVINPVLSLRTLVGGAGFDLSGVLECMEGDCGVRLVDKIVRQTWHSFDKVIVSGFDAQKLAQFVRRGITDEVWRFLERDLLNHIKVALYVRDTGADELLVFRDRPHAFCEQHFRAALELAGFGDSLESAEERLQEALLENSEVLVGSNGSERLYGFKSPSLAVTSVIKDPGNLPESEIARLAARSVAQSYSASLLRNGVLARNLTASLGQAIRLGAHTIDGPRDSRLAEAVSYNLEIPIIDNVPIRELLAARLDTVTEFHAFQAALRKAIEERIKALPAGDPEAISESVYDDVLEPELIRLGRKIEQAAAILAKRSIAAVTVGAAITTVGLLSFAPLAVPGIVIGAGGLLANLNEFWKDKREVELSDLYFLWRIAEASH